MNIFLLKWKALKERLKVVALWWFSLGSLWEHKAMQTLHFKQIYKQRQTRSKAEKNDSAQQTNPNFNEFYFSWTNGQTAQTNPGSWKHPRQSLHRWFACVPRNLFVGGALCLTFSIYGWKSNASVIGDDLFGFWGCEKGTFVAKDKAGFVPCRILLTWLTQTT